MAATSVTGRRLIDRAEEDRAGVEARLALGASVPEALGPTVRQAVTTAMIPILDQTKNVGLVTLPGTFVGLILGGATPAEAARVQLTVLLALLAVELVAAPAAARLTVAGLRAPASGSSSVPERRRAAGREGRHDRGRPVGRQAGAQPLERRQRRASRPGPRCRRGAAPTTGAAPSASTSGNASPGPAAIAAASPSGLASTTLTATRPATRAKSASASTVTRWRGTCAPTNASITTASTSRPARPASTARPSPTRTFSPGARRSPRWRRAISSTVGVDLDHLLAVARPRRGQRPRQRARRAADVHDAPRAGRLDDRASSAGSRTRGATRPRGRHNSRPSRPGAAAGPTGARGRAAR